MRIIVGIPAFRISGLLRKCLNALVNTPASVIVVDNNADQDIKDLLANEFAGRVEIISLPENTYCNGGWGKIMEFGLEHSFDIVGLGSSDATLPPYWYETITQRAAQFHDEVWVPAIGEPVENYPNYRNAEHVLGGVAGFFTFLPKAAVELVFPIPPTLKHWFGDQYMYTKLRDAGWHVTIMHDIRAYHQQGSVSRANPDTGGVIESDKRAWAALEEAKLEIKI